MSFFNALTGYSSPGPGVDKNRPQKKRFFLFFELYFRKFTRIIGLNLLYLICCLPIVTIGPATAGFVYILRCFAREEHCFMFSDFFDAVMKNWKQALAASIINVIVLGINITAIVLYVQMMNRTGNTWLLLLVALCILTLVIFIIMHYYLYLIMITFDLKLGQIYKNAFLFTFLGLKTNLITTFFVGVIGFLLYRFYPFTIVFIVPLAIATMGFIVIFNVYPLVKKYMINRYYEQHPEEKKLRYFDEEYQEEMQRIREQEAQEHSFDYLPIQKIGDELESDSQQNIEPEDLDSNQSKE